MKHFKLLLAMGLFLSIGTTAQQSQKSKTASASSAKAFAGHWQKGVFSLSSFEEPNGKYVGPANETSVSYVIDEGGNAREYFIANTNTYNCRTQILGFRTGKIVMNTADQSFEFRPSAGYNTTLSCMSKSAAKKPYSTADLYPAYTVKGHLKTGADGHPVLITYRNGSSHGLELRPMN